MARELLKGNEAIAEAAIRAGLQAYFGYPITPQTELLEWMSRRMPELGRAFVQAESELGAINMVYGAACTGARVMTSSSSPGISLMMEGISYIAGTEVPMVLVDVMRGGPGLGNIAPAQSDYNQIVRGGSHGDYHPIVLAPASIQEAIDLTVLSFDLAEKYRSVAVVLLDGSLGQMMEPGELPPMRPLRVARPEWAAYGARRPREAFPHFHLSRSAAGRGNQPAPAAPLAGSPGQRSARKGILHGRRPLRRRRLRLRRACRALRGARCPRRRHPGWPLRPISLSPFPTNEILKLCDRTEGFLVVEMNTGQMLEDVRLATAGRRPVEFYGRMGGVMPFPDEILAEIRRMAQGEMSLEGHPRDRWLQRMTAMN